jgi:nucleoid DNA-binding protein
MTRSEFETALQQKLEIPKHFIEDAVSAFINAVVDSLSNGQKVKIDGFGLFSLKIKNANRKKDVSTGVYIERPERKIINFQSLMTKLKKHEESDT